MSKVFISYSHDSTEHSERVLNLTWALRNHGIDVELDQFHNEEIVDWPRWCRQQIKREQSDFVLCICTAEYQRRIEGEVSPEKGKGVYWEGSLLDDEIYDAKGNRRIVPVLFDNEPESNILDFLRGWTYCRLSQFTLTDPGYEHLLRLLTGQAKVEKNRLGTVPVLPTEHAPVVPAPSTTGKYDISRILKYAPTELIGRESEMQLLNDAWKKACNTDIPRTHVLTFVALGGEGKTSLVAKWAADLAGRDWPGCEAAFAWSFYSQGTRDQASASSDTFLREALIFFGDPEMANSAQGAYEKGRWLAQLVGERCSLLILDGLEPLQYAPTSPTPGELKDQGLAALLKGLAAANKGLCIVTTRYSFPELKAYRQTTAPEKELLRLSKEAGVALLKALEVKGTQKEYETLVEDVKGHALTLNLFGTFLRDAHGGDIRKRDLVKFEEADAEEQGGHAFRVMDAYVRSFEKEGEKGLWALALLRIMGLFDRPADSGCLEALWNGEAIAGLTDPLVGLTETQRNIALKRLEDAKLLTIHRDTTGTLLFLDAHPLIREYFAKQFRENNNDAWRAGHKRLYEYLTTSTPDKDEPTLEDLQPLCQAVAHGCLSGQHKHALEVYRKRISQQHKAEARLLRDQLGAVGTDMAVLACFFQEPWITPVSTLAPDDQASMLIEAGLVLRLQGRFLEGEKSLREGKKQAFRHKNYDQATDASRHLSQLQLLLGRLNAALKESEEGILLADRKGVSNYHKVTTQATYGDVLHQCGQLIKAENYFQLAETTQQETEPKWRYLYRLPGSRYCDLLLSLGNYKQVMERTQETSRYHKEQVYMLGFAANRLMMVRSQMAKRLQEGRRVNTKTIKKTLDNTVKRIRSAGQYDYMPRALLTRAWLRFLEKDIDGAKQDLDEAWEIAERGPMRLFMADIHLHRARLFKDKDELAKARAMIEQCGYWRRKEELEDAEEAAKGW